MLKYILLGLVILWLFYSPTVRRALRSMTSSAPQAERPSTPTMMLTCAHCGAHFPADEAVSVSQAGTTQHFCCKEHMQRGPRQTD